MENAMSDLNSDDRALLEGARVGHEPTESDRARVRAALATRLGGGAGLATGTLVMSKAAATGVLTKVVLSAALLATVAGVTAVAYRGTNHAAEVALASSSAPLHEPTLVLDREEAPGSIEESSSQGIGAGVGPAPAAMAPSKPSLESESPRPRAMRTPRVDETVARASVATSDPLAAPPPSSPSAPVTEPPAMGLFATGATPAFSAPLARTTLEAETSLVRDGVAALNGGDAARALALFDEHARTFAGGVFTEERAAERVVALRALHRCAEARVAASEFVRDYPRSPLAARVLATCDSPNP
jgi:hypothetical protein